MTNDDFEFVVRRVSVVENTVGLIGCRIASE